ncbi:MAG: phosphatase PAP2 family protein [Chitinophagaceae bacterium]|nr:MAG: phosphatase PAP2 family protein [Chitinophagaceae bacterium]
MITKTGSILKTVLFLVLTALSLPALSQNWDIDIVKAINPQQPDAAFFRATTSSVYAIGIAAPVGLFATGLIRNDPNLKRKSYEMVAAALVELGITGIMKNTIDRRRPAEKYPRAVFPYESHSGKSMPSGHTAMAFVTATSLSLQFKRWYVVIPSYLWATAVGYSRIYLGVHYPSDIIIGALVGAGSAYVTHWLNCNIIQKRRRQ